MRIFVIGLAHTGDLSRGTRARLVTAPYEEREGWNLNAMLVDGMIYIEEHLTEAQLVGK